MAKQQFQVKVNTVVRDTLQGLYGNRILLSHPGLLEIFKKWDALHVATKGQATQFSAIEIGGAQPQVDSVYLGVDFNETIRQVTTAAPHTPKRPLWRGANGFNLVPKNIEELEAILSQLAEDTAGQNLQGDTTELLRVKVFDSQGVLKEVESSLEIIAKLRGKGYPVTAEVAIPYSQGKEYPDTFFVDRIIGAAKLADKYGIPASAFRVSLKDMVGELNAEDAARIVRKVIEGLQQENLNIELGLHLHDTGLACEAYVAAIKVCQELAWPISIDTVEGKDTGFASIIAVDKALGGEGLGLTSAQRIVLNKMAAEMDAVQEAYKPRRVQVALTGEELRRYKIPGGGLASFEAAVQSMDLADKLGLSHIEAMRIAGTALIAVGHIMGHPFAVTPGFQNKQIAALNLLSNMIDGGYLKAGMGYDGVEAAVLAELTDEQVQNYFLKGLAPAVQNFLKGDMPTAMRSVVRDTVGYRQGLLTDGLVSQLTKTTDEVKALQKKGLVRPTVTQAHTVLQGVEQKAEIIAALLEKGLIYTKPDGKACEKWKDQSFATIQSFINDEPKAKSLVKALAKAARQSNISWATVLSASLTDRVEQPWLREPDASEYTTASAYADAVKRYQSGRSFTPDAVDGLVQAWRSSALPTEDALTKSAALLKAEHNALRAWVLQFIEQKGFAFIHAIKQGDEQIVADAVNAIYKQQRESANQHLRSTGHPFLYPVEQRIDMAIAYFVESVEQLVAEFGKSSVNIQNVVDAVKSHKVISSILSPMPGTVVEVKVKKGDVIKAGDIIAVIEAMKMQVFIKASADGVVDSVLVTKEATLQRGQDLVQLQVKAPAFKTSEHNGNGVVEDGVLATKFKTKLATLQQEVTTETVVAVSNDDATLPQPEPLSSAQKRGYNRDALAKGLAPHTAEGKYLHIVANRAGCATKIVGDLEQMGEDVRVLYVDGDKTTPVVANAPAEKKVLVKSYTDHGIMIKALRELADANPGKTLLFHPGWGFLAENDAFVARVEQELAGRVIFVGPKSKPMEVAGGKKTLRDLVQEIAPDLNPGYIGNKKHTAAELKAYIDGGFLADNPLHLEYKGYFDKVKAMGGDVMIKAVAGGGGRGITRFANGSYEDYVRAVYKTVEEGERLFGNGEVLTEQCITGKTRHLEVQFAATAGQAICLGMRDCTAQIAGQKFAELNLIAGDYAPEMITQIREELAKVANRLAQDGYEGLGTLEMLVVPETGKICVLEVNPRLQVEHGVTEQDIALKTKKQISLPVLNAHLLTNTSGKSPEQILEDVFGLTKDDLAKVEQLGSERITHLRINSKEVDLKKGQALPTWVGDAMWPVELSTEIARANGIVLLQGGLGKGVFDPQIGAILGAEDKVLKAAKQLHDALELAKLPERAHTANTNLSTTLAVYSLMFNTDGTVNREFTTRSMDELLANIQSGKAQVSTQTTIWPGQQVVKPEDVLHPLYGTTAPEQKYQVKIANGANAQLSVM